MKKRITTLCIFAISVAFLSTMPVIAAFDSFDATLYGVAGDEFGLISLNLREDAEVTFSIGEGAIIFMRFDEPVRFATDYVTISTSIPVIGYADAESTGAQTIAVILDGNEVDSGSFPTMRPTTEETGGYLGIDLTPSGLLQAEPFNTLEIQFMVNNLPRGIEDPEYTPEEYMPPITETPSQAENYIGIPPEPPQPRARRPVNPGVIVGIALAVATSVTIPCCYAKKSKEKK